MRNIPALSDTLFAGDSKVVTVGVYDENQELVNIAGASAVFSVYDGPTLLFSKAPGDGLVVNSTSLTVTLDPDDTANLGGTSYKVYNYECEVTDTSGNVTTVAWGLFTVTKAFIS